MLNENSAAQTTQPVSVQRTARTAGVLYLILAVCGGFAQFFVREALIVTGDAAATASNILASQTLFRSGIAAELTGQVAFVLLVLALYRLLKQVNRNQALLMVMFVLVAVSITALNMLNQFAALYVLSGAEHLTAFDAGQLEALSLTFLDFHHTGYLIAQVFFGLWLLPLGYLIYRSGFIPKLIGVLLVIACFGFLVDVVTFFLLPGFGVEFSLFTSIGEFVLLLWLLIRGVDVQRWEQASLRPA